MLRSFEGIHTRRFCKKALTILLAFILILSAGWLNGFATFAAAADTSEFSITKNTVIRYDLQDRHRIEYWIIDTGRPGINVAVLAGVHGDEVAGTAAAYDMIHNPAFTAGRVLIIPRVNRLAVALNDRYPGRQNPNSNFLPETSDHIGYSDLNMAFPGSPTGTTTEQIAWVITEILDEFQPDLLIDLHEALQPALPTNNNLGNTLLSPTLTLGNPTTRITNRLAAFDAIDAINQSGLASVSFPYQPRTMVEPTRAVSTYAVRYDIPAFLTETTRHEGVNQTYVLIEDIPTRAAQHRFFVEFLANWFHDFAMGGSTESDPLSFRYISAGSEHTLAIHTDGRVFVWGSNNAQNRLGIRDAADQDVPVPVCFAHLNHVSNDFVQVVASVNHSMALHADGRIFVWGTGGSGRLGTGDTTSQLRPIEITMPQGEHNDFIYISASEFHSIAVHRDGRVFNWGSGGSGRLGTGNTDDRFIPVEPDFSGLGISNDFIQTNAGSQYAVALHANGRLYAWGFGGSGRLGVGDTVDRFTPTEVVLSNVSDFADGFRYISVASIGTHALAIHTDGRVFAWGAGGQGRLGTGTTANQFIPIEINTSHFVGLDNNFVHVSAGIAHSLFVHADGRIFGAGSNTYGRLGTGDTVTQNQLALTLIPQGIEPDFVFTSTFRYHSFAIHNDGTVFAWGGSEDNRLGTGSSSLSPLILSHGVQQAVIDLIASLPPIGELTLQDLGLVQAARNAFNALPHHAQGFVTNYALLLEAEAQMEILRAQSGSGTQTPPTQSESYPTQPGPAPTQQEPAPTPFPFIDVSSGAWYREYIEFVWEEGLMTGVSSTAFAPQDTLSRAMVATIIHRMAGEPTVDFYPEFSDVPAGLWYSNAVVWAAQNEIVFGIGGGQFAPHANVTRQEMATMLFRYAEAMGFDPGANGWASDFIDAYQISGWALEALQWATYNDLIRGQGGDRVNPTGTATRAERAAIIARFVTAFK